MIVPSLLLCCPRCGLVFPVNDLGQSRAECPWCYLDFVFRDCGGEVL